MENVRKFLDNVVTNVREFFRSPSSARTLTLIALVVLAIALPVTVVVLQQTTQTRQQASSNLCTDRHGTCVPLGICRAEGLTCLGGFGCPGGTACYNPCSVAGGECGVNSDCCGGQNLYCARTGKCTKYCQQTKTYNVCNGVNLCTLVNAVNNVCNSSEYIDCQPSAKCGYHSPSCEDPSHLPKQGGCYKYNCPNGKVTESGSCTAPDSVCCIDGTTQYSCIFNHLSTSAKVDASTPNNDYETNGGDTQWCKDNQYCSDNGQWQNSVSNVCHDIDPNSCSCAASDSLTNKSFTCSNGFVKRACGQDMICSNSHKGAQGGVWPCIPTSSKYIGQVPIASNILRCGANNAGICIWDGAVGLGHGPYGLTTDQTETCSAFCPDIPSCKTISGGAYVDISAPGNACPSSLAAPYACCAPVAPQGNPAACQAVGGYCGKFGDACKAGYDESYGALSCGSGTVCCVPQPSCSDAHGYCSSYSSNNGQCTAGHVQNSTFPGCGSSGICCIPLAPEGPTNCGSLNGKCIAAGNSCPSNYEINNLGEKSCGSGNICCIPKGTGTSSCGAEGQACCSSGNKCQNSLVCSNNTCVKPNGCGNNCPTPTPACTNGKDTKLALSVKLDGIGTNTYENNNPAHPNRSGKIRVYDAATPNKNIHSSSQAFNHGKSNGKFDSTTVDIGKGLTCSATYKVEVRLPGYLPASAQVKYGDTSQVISLEPLPGDINMVDGNGIIIGDGKIDVNDYSIYRQCRNQDPTTPIDFKSDTTDIQVKCGDLINFYDFQDGGTMESNVFAPSGIGEWDANYNLWLRSYIKANGY